MAPGAGTDDDPLDDEEPEEGEELELPSILFPIAGRASYRDTYHAPRDGGSRLHNGTDIFAERGTPVVAVANGVVERMGYGEDAGLFVVVRHSDGWRSVYVHLNNDSPSTDNGLAVHYGPGIQVGSRVSAGTVVGYVGDSGNAEESSPHLHFELHQPDGLRPNPYPALREARRTGRTNKLPTVDYRAIETEGAEMISHLDLETGFNADIEVLDGHAYIGTWGTSDRCPGTGVRIVDVSDPLEPILVGSFADHSEFPGSATDSIWIGNVTNDHFDGRLGIVALRDCDNQLTGEDHLVGFATYDLNEPSEPSLIGSHETIGGGLSGFDVLVYDDQLTIAAVISTVRPNMNGPIDVVSVIDVTNPSDPVAISTWVPELAPSTPPTDAADGVDWHFGSISWANPGSVTADLYPGGRFEIDMTDPSMPVGVLSPSQVSNSDPEEAPESDEQPSGYHREVGSVRYGTTGRLIVGLSDGARLLDVGDPTIAPIQAASFIPAPAFDPQHWWLAPDEGTEFSMVWDADVSDGLVYLSDHHSGLWVVEITATLNPISGPNEVD